MRRRSMGLNPVLAAGLALALLMSGCKVNVAGSGGRGGFSGIGQNVDRAVSGVQFLGAVNKASEEFTGEQKYYLGRSLAANIISRYGIYEDAEATAYVNRVGQALALFCSAPEAFAGYRFILLNSDDINAFAAPGAFVFVTRGLLRCCESEDELAAVLAHELAHIQHDDPVMAVKQGRAAEAWKIALEAGSREVKGAEASRAAGAFGTMIAEGVEQLMVKGYSRDQEQKADRGAVEIMKKAGYDTRAMITMLSKMARNLKSGGPDFFKTHPAPADRIKGVQPVVAQSGEPQIPEVRRQRFDSALTRAKSK